MRIVRILLIWLLANAMEVPVSAQNAGIPVTDMFSEFKLPALQDTAGGVLPAIVGGLQVGSRSRLLGLSAQSALDAWTQAQALPTTSRTPPARPVRRASEPMVFSGSTASALNKVLSGSNAMTVQVTAPILTVDQPIEIQRSGIDLDLGAAQLVAANPQPYMLRIENAAGVTVSGGKFISGDSAILIHASNAIGINGTQISGLHGAGIVVTGSRSVHLWGNRISGLPLAGITIHRGTIQSVVESNNVSGGTGFSNMAAGIVVTDREIDLTSNPRAIFGPDGYWVIEQPMLKRLNPPRHNLIIGNQVHRNKASGIYVDGGIETVISSNSISGNSKEGLCLDNGSTSNVVYSNIVIENGNRWGEPDSVLALDSVLVTGRLTDGTAAAKVPGISIDNAIYNIVFGNNVSRNFGGGIKIVRTGYFNMIGLNTILDNNAGASNAFHFFGLELGAALGDSGSTELDFTPSRGNLVFSNAIRSNHYSGIFFDFNSDQNDVLDNTILDATAWALEAVKQMPNNSLNNLTNLRSRNMGSGLDPALLNIGQPVNDPPQ